MALTTEIKIGEIGTPKALMMRIKLDPKTVTKYVKDMEGGASFPPILVFEVDGKMVLADGYHRHSAYQKRGIETVHADVQIGTMDDAILAAVRANAHEGLKRSDADKEKAVKALLASDKWCGMSNREIGREAGVHHTTVEKIKKSMKSIGYVANRNDTNKATVLCKGGRRYPATRSKPKSKPVEQIDTSSKKGAPGPVQAPDVGPAAAPAASTVASAVTPPYRAPLPKLTWQQLGAPAPGTEDEQDPDSPPGVTRTMAWTRKHGHVHIRPLDEKLRVQREQKVTSFITALRDLGKPATELMKHDMDPDEFFATLREIKGAALATKFRERMEAIEPLLTRLNALSAGLRATKNTTEAA
jgi:DNA-binding CsgD family transcriptional regulator/uncharacterized ParB-like nuclease family protein